MNKFKKATKRITAVAATAALVSNAVFGAGLSNYPSMFGVEKFQGQIVIGSEADSAAATSIIESLAAELSGEEEKVMISYKKASSGSELDVMDSKKAELNIGDSLNSVLADKLTESDEEDFLADEDVNGEDYTQEFDLSIVDGSLELVYDKSLSSDAVVGVKLNDGQKFAKYDLAFAVDADTSDFVGETIEIMGKTFTIKSIGTDSLVLLGGANQVSLGEGESSTVEVEGVSYEVTVESVSSSKVLITVNGEAVTVKELESEDVAGTNVLVTEVFSSDRNGYATVIVGGSEISIKAGEEVKVTDAEGDLDKISDVHEGYVVDATSSANYSYSLTWSVDEDVLLEQGESLNDVLFGAFSLNLGELSDAEMTEVKASAGSDYVSLNVGKVSLDDLFYGENSTTVKLIGDDDENAFLLSGNTGDVLDLEHIDAVGTRFITGSVSEEEAHIYEIVDITEEDNDYDLVLKVLTDGNKEITVAAEDLNDELETTGFSVSDMVNNATATAVYPVANDSTSGDEKRYLTLGTLGNQVELANEILMTLSNTKASFTLDHTDIDVADSTEALVAGNESFDIEVSYNDADEEMRVKFVGALWTVKQASESDKDNKLGYSVMGSTVRFDSEDTQEVVVEMAATQRSADVSYTTGAVAEAMSVTVSAEEADAKVEELEAEGYTVSTKKVSSKAVEFDIEAPVMADEVSGTENMIVVGGPAVNSVAVSLLGEGVVGVEEGEAVVRYFADANSVLVYGWDAAGTQAAANKLNAGGLTGDKVDVQ